jgi:sec-independent protein translocase protein TatC
MIIALSLLGILSYELLARTRAYAIVIIGIVIAIVSPTPDPMTFITLAIPVMAMYEGCIWIVWLIERRKAARPLE